MKHSVEISALNNALSNFQGQLKPVPKDATNPFFHSKYADLATIWDNIREPLKANGLAITQVTSVDGERVVLTTVILHTSGQWLSGDYLLSPVKSDPQSMGSAMTYARRYALSAILGIVADEDDDGESTMQRGTQQRTAQKPATPEPKPEAGEKRMISEAQRRKIFASANQMCENEDAATIYVKALMKAKFKTEHTSGLTVVQASDLIKSIEAGETVKPVNLEEAEEDKPE